MKVEGNFVFEAPRAHVYAVLRDSTVLRDCIPGCESLTLQEDGRYLAKMKVGISAIRGTFTGHVQITDEVEATSYRLLVDGSGGPGFVKGQGLVTLSDAENGTRVDVSGEAQVGGMIAGVGQRVLAPAARMLMTQFFECMQKKAQATAPSASC